LAPGIFTAVTGVTVTHRRTDGRTDIELARCVMAKVVVAKGELGKESRLFPWFAWCGLVYI